MNNSNIKQLLKQQGIYQWQIAKQLGITEGTFSKWFREPLNKVQQTQVLSAIEAIKLSRIKEQQTK